MTRNRGSQKYKVPCRGNEIELEYKTFMKVKESLTFNEVQRLIAACDTLEKKALIELAVTTGIRRDDIVNIEVNRIDLDECKLFFWEEKKDRVWVVALPPELVQTLRMFIKTLPKDQRYLFDFSGRTAYNMLQKLIKRANIRKHIPFHGLRRTCIRLSKRMGRDVRFVMDQTGDTARVILEEYEGYTTDEMVEMLRDDNILKRAKELNEDKKNSISELWEKVTMEVVHGKQFDLDHFSTYHR